MKEKNILIKWKFPLLLGLALSLLYLNYFENKAVVEFDLSVSEPTMFNIYWAGADQDYSQWRRARVRVTPGQEKYRFALTDLAKVRKLRIDTHQYEGQVLLKKMVISQNGYQPLRFEGKEGFSSLQPIFDIDSCVPGPEGLRVNATGNDPQLELMLKLNDGSSRFWPVAVRIVAIFSLIAFFFVLTENCRSDEQFIPVFFAVAFALVLAMASISQENVHPDEYVHLDAGNYYKTNLLPPEVDDPAIAETYSVYGVSRLNSREVSYLFTGKLAELLTAFRISDLLGLRMFNILLMGALLLYLLNTTAIRFMAAPLLISPQLWYVFSYSNSDAFALALSFIVACQVVFPASSLNRYLLSEDSPGRWKGILLGLFCSLLFLLKSNYLIFIFFIVFYMVWRVLFRVEQEKRRVYCRRFVVIVLVGMSLAGLRIGADYWVNGLNRAERMTQTHEKLADYLYKPSTPLTEKHNFLYRKARGETLKTIIVVDRWFEKTYRSAFGMYGYFTAVGTDAYYGAMRAVGIALFVFFSSTIILFGGKRRNLLFAGFILCSSALIGVSLYHSWTVDYQTQGRYLFPIIPMACVVLYHSRHLMQGAVYKVLLTAMFLLSVYSFVFVALLQLPKIT
jgi:hypothetical protein